MLTIHCTSLNLTFFVCHTDRYSANSQRFMGVHTGTEKEYCFVWNLLVFYYIVGQKTTLDNFCPFPVVAGGQLRIIEQNPVSWNQLRFNKQTTRMFIRQKIIHTRYQNPDLLSIIILVVNQVNVWLNRKVTIVQVLNNW